MRTVRLLRLFILKNKLNFIFQLTKDGVSEFKINEDRVSKHEYKKYIHDTLNIPTNAAEILIIKQGRLETSPFIKGGEDLTALLEKASGSYQYKKEYEEIMSKTL